MHGIIPAGALPIPGYQVLLDSNSPSLTVYAHSISANSRPTNTPEAPSPNSSEAANHEEKRLTLRSGGTLGLRRPVETGQVRERFSHGRSRAVTVEVRKKRVDEANAAPRGRTLTAEEHATRVRILQDARKADEEAHRRAALAEADRRRLVEEQAKEEARPDRRQVTTPLPLRTQLPPMRKRPRAVRGVPSVFGYVWSERNTVVMRPSSANIPIFPFPSSEGDHAKRLEACRTLALDLAQELDDRRFNVREEYKLELKRYADRLPSEPEERNILLADAAARTVRDMFAAEADFLPVPFAARLKTILEYHIGVRAYYPEVEAFYRDVRSGRLQQPLPLDAFTGVVNAVKAHTPEIFDPSVVSAIGDGTQPRPIISQNEPTVPDQNQPVPPSDPLGELDPTKAHDYQAAGIVNKLWQVFEAGGTVHKAVDGWYAAYNSLAPPVAQILDWLQQFVKSKFGS